MGVPQFMNFFHLLIIIGSFTTSLAGYCGESNYQVEMVRNKAFYQFNDLETPLTKGMRLPIGAEIQTLESSMVKIKLPKGGAITIGPLSKVILKESSQLENLPVFEMIKGNLRAKFQKNQHESTSPKLFIKTSGVSIGIRGTDFLMAHNELNQVSSILAFEGTVYASKINSDKEREQNAIAPMATEINVGEISLSVPNYLTVGTPTTLSKKQFPLLKNNHQLNFHNGSNNQIEIVQSEPVNNDQKLMVDSLPNIDPDEQLELKPGGVLDIKTALYLAPDENGPIGNIDKKTGDFIPPEGLTLDPINGFQKVSEVIKNFRKDTMENLELLSQKFNNLLLKDKVLKNVHNFIKTHKYLSRLKINADFSTLYKSHLTHFKLNEFQEFSNEDSWAFHIQTDVIYKKFFTPQLYIKPKFSFFGKYHIDSLDKITTYDEFDLSYSLELGKKGSAFKRPNETYARFEKNNNYRKKIPTRNFVDFFDIYNISLGNLIRARKNYGLILEYTITLFKNLNDTYLKEHTLKNVNIFDLSKNQTLNVEVGYILKERTLNNKVELGEFSVEYIKRNFFEQTNLNFLSKYTNALKIMGGPFINYFELKLGLETTFNGINLAPFYQYTQFEKAPIANQYLIGIGLKINY